VALMVLLAAVAGGPFGALFFSVEAATSLADPSFDVGPVLRCRFVRERSVLAHSSFPFHKMERLPLGLGDGFGDRILSLEAGKASVEPAIFMEEGRSPLPPGKREGESHPA